MRVVVLAVVLAGCGFDGAMGTGDSADDSDDADEDVTDDTDPADDPTDGEDAPPTDGPTRPLELIELAWGTSIESQTVEVVADANPDAELVVLAVASKPYLEPVGVMGGGTWNFVGTQCGPRGQTGVTLYTRTTAGASEPVTVTFADNPRSAVMVIAAYSGATHVAGVLTASAFPDVCDRGDGDIASYTYDFPAVQGRSVIEAVATRQYGHTTMAPGIQRGQMQAQPGGDGDIAGLALVDGLAFDPVVGELTSASDVAVVAIAVD